jgi:hypothetical protein
MNPLRFQILCIFDMRNTNKFKDANTEIKTKRGQTGASTAVIFKHRLDVLRSDPLLFFSLKSFIMRNTNDECNCTRCNAQELIDKVIGFNDWAFNAPKIKETLMRLLLNYMSSERIEEDNLQQRELIAFHVYLINNLLDDVFKFELNNPKTKAA